MTEDQFTTFGEKLRELRVAAGMTQEALARAAGLSLGNVRNYEQGLREPRWQNLFQLAAALGVSTNVFAVCVGTEAPAEGEGTKAAPKRGRKAKGGE